MNVGLIFYIEHKKTYILKTLAQFTNELKFYSFSDRKNMNVKMEELT